MVIQLPDGQVGLQQRVLPESPLASTGTTTADKVSYIEKDWEVETMNNEELALIVSSRERSTVVSRGSPLLWITTTGMSIPSCDQQKILIPMCYQQNLNCAALIFPWMFPLIMPYPPLHGRWICTHLYIIHELCTTSNRFNLTYMIDGNWHVWNWSHGKIISTSSYINYSYDFY